MRNLFIAIIVSTGLHVNAQEDYKIKMNDSTFGISLNRQYQVLVNGQRVNLKLTLNDTLSYDDPHFSFLHLKEYQIAKTQIDKGIDQILLVTAEGSGILIQSYSTISPVSLNEVMLKEITKENLSYGYELNREDYERTLKSGQKVTVDRAVLSYKGKRNVYEIMTIGKKDEGTLILTILQDGKNEQALGIIELMWKSFIYK